MKILNEIKQKKHRKKCLVNLRGKMKNFNQQIVMKDLPQFSKIYLVPLADFHLGCKDVGVDVIRGYIGWIKDNKNAYTILNGDLMNCAGKDTAPELYDDLTTPDDAYFSLRAMLMPIKDKILMITRGNHEDMIWRRVGVDFMARLAYDLGETPYKPDGGMVGIRLSKNNHSSVFFIYATHGWGGARTIGAKVKKTEDLAVAIEADCYVLSHDHTQNMHRNNRLVPPKSRLGMKNVYLQVQRQLLVNTGGFITYSGYVQKKGLSPQDLGTPRIRLELKKDTRHYFKDIHGSM